MVAYIDIGIRLTAKEGTLAGWLAYLITHPSPTRQYLPKEMTTACPGPVLLKSPRMMAPLDMIVLPPRMMF
jgi:hypothetical protein